MTHQLFFRGWVNLNAVLDELSSTGMIDATDILIAGCSAGGLATYFHGTDALTVLLLCGRFAL